jgi:hypothetical protein
MGNGMDYTSVAPPGEKCLGFCEDVGAVSLRAESELQCLELHHGNSTEAIAG